MGRAKSAKSRGLSNLARQIAAAVAGSPNGEKRKAERKLTAAEVEGLLASGDEATGGFSDAGRGPALLDQVLAGLTVRRRAILIAVLRRDGSRRAIAQRLGISVRTLDAELSHALEQASRNLQRHLSGKG